MTTDFPANSPKVSRNRRPDGMSLEDWQIALRRQYGRNQDFSVTNIGDDAVFSEFKVHNAVSGNTYRVAIRGTKLGDNYCSCPDFETNHLGTCKHIEWMLAHLEHDVHQAKRLHDGFFPPYTEIFLKYGSQRKVVFRAGSECPDELKQLAQKYFNEDGLLTPDAIGKFPSFLSKAGEIGHEVRCYDDVLAFIAEVRDEQHRKQHLETVFPVGARSANLNNVLRLPLYGYQRKGALFAAKAGRCLIGDDMGLGKTVQALAAAEILASESGVEKVLVVCPTSLKHQWAREVEKFTHRSQVVVEGTAAKRADLYAEDSFYKITNYDTIPQDLALIGRFAPDLVIVDEAQRIKNWDTLIAKSVKRIDSPYAIVLTGTPLENRLEELVSIVQFVDRHRLGPTYRFLDEHQQRDETGRVVGYQNLDDVAKTLEPIFLRRTKSEVLDELPERIEKNFFVRMTSQQWDAHQENRETVARIVQRWKRVGSLREPEQRRLMIALQNMRMACNSTYLLDQETDHSVKPDELVALLTDLFETPKVKVVVFSQWTRTLELIVRRLDAAGIRHVFFHGGISSKRRKEFVRHFHDDADCRLFLSTDAGGVGLNLQVASVVINLDLPWNPAILDQRIGRVHRIGQTEPVQVVNMIAEGTIEEGMLHTLAFKKSLMEGVLDGGQSEVFLGEGRFQQFMETVESVTDSISKTPPEPATEIESVVTRTPGPIPFAPYETPPSPVEETEDVPEPVANVSTDAWNDLIQNGMTVLQQLAAGNLKSIETTRDESSGQEYLKIPLPKPELLQETLTAVNKLLQSLQR